ncbi:MAG: nitroreductase family protein, partial [bacterium]
MADAAAQAAVDAAITSRRSIRAFLPRPVPQADVEHLLDVAARAPSGSNIQPWKVHALAGVALKRLC